MFLDFQRVSLIQIPRLLEFSQTLDHIIDGQKCASILAFLVISISGVDGSILTLVRADNYTNKRKLAIKPMTNTKLRIYVPKVKLY